MVVAMVIALVEAMMGALRGPGSNQALNLSSSLTFREGDVVADLTTRRGVVMGATGAEAFRPFCRTAQVESRTVPPPLLQNAPVGGRISLALRSWSQLTEDKWVLDIVKNGHLIEFMEMPRFMGLTKTPLGKGEKANILWKEVHSLMAKDDIEYVSPEQENEGFYSRFFLVKKEARWAEANFQPKTFKPADKETDSKWKHCGL